jgi:hypothetical protein
MNKSGSGTHISCLTPIYALVTCVTWGQTPIYPRFADATHSTICSAVIGSEVICTP